MEGWMSKPHTYSYDIKINSSFTFNERNGHLLFQRQLRI